MAFNRNNNQNNINFNNQGNAPQGAQPIQPSGKAPKVKKERLQNVSKYSHTRNVILILALVVVAVIGMNIVSSYKMRQTVSVVTLVSDVPQDGIIKEDIMKEVKMSVEEFERQGVVTLADGTKRKAIVTWQDRDKIKNTFASYYIRRNTAVFWDAIGSDTDKKYSYLYSMDGELLKIDIDADTFGQMLVPGDHINVRAAYTEEVYTLPTAEELRLQQETGIQPQTSVKRQILLFNNVPILDILNSSGESIFDKYYALLSLPKAQQEAMINSEDFLSSVEPSQILLNVTPEEADRYMSIQASGPRYMMTLLPRTSSNAITEVLNELQVGFARKDK